MKGKTEKSLEGKEKDVFPHPPVHGLMIDRWEVSEAIPCSAFACCEGLGSHMAANIEEDRWVKEVLPYPGKETSPEFQVSPLRRLESNISKL